MKQLSKIMLAAVASVALAAPAFAWDFSASGTATASFNQTSEKSNSLAATKEDTSSSGFSSEGSGLTISSSNTDGANTATFSYTVDWDDDLDETIAVSGSKKVGEWTASGAVSYNLGRNGCSNAASDNVSNIASGAVACSNQQSADDTTSVTLTNGTMTIVMGDASHLSTQNVSAGTGAAGLDGMDSADADTAVGAMVDSYHGVSLGYAISDTMTVTVAMQADDGDAFGAGNPLDGDTSATHNTSGFGVGFSGTFGPATIGFTQASASTADATNNTAASLLSTSWSTMGLGVKIDLGDIDPFISYGTATGTAGSDSTIENKHGGSEIGLTYALGADTVTLVMGSLSDQGSSTDKPTEWSIMEVGYATMVGPASLSVGYGTIAKTDADNTAVDGYSKTDLDVALSISF